MKKAQFDWDKYADVCLVVLIKSSVLGWIEVARFMDISEARRKFDAMDAKHKLLLNFGQIVSQEGQV